VLKRRRKVYLAGFEVTYVAVQRPPLMNCRRREHQPYRLGSVKRRDRPPRVHPPSQVVDVPILAHLHDHPPVPEGAALIEAPIFNLLVRFYLASGRTR
jgi:hypothetical protein